MKKKLWIVTELFYPDETSTAYILTKIAGALAQKYDVRVICGPVAYEEQHSCNAVPGYLQESVKIIRVSGCRMDKNNLLLRSFRFLFLSLQLSSKLWRNVGKSDKVLIVTNPAPLLLLVSLIKSIKKFELSVLVHDIFPENTVPAGIIKSSDKISYKILKSVFDRAYSKADTLIALGRDMKHVLETKIKKYSSKRTPRVEIIENWAETDMIGVMPREEALAGLPEDKVIIQYAGNLGRVQGLITLLHVIEEAANDCLHFCFWGTGAVMQEMEQFVKEHELDNISFYGAFPREDQNKVLNACDLSIVTLSDGMYGLGVPSKTYNIMAAGKPVLFLGNKNSEQGIMIKEYDTGYCFEPSDKAGLLHFLQKLSPDMLPELKEKGLKARETSETVYAEKVILNKFFKAI